MNTIQILIIKLSANYSSSCHFKIKVVANTSSVKDSVENKHSFKYEKGTTETNINEKLELQLSQPLNSETKLQFFLEVYTKTGYKTAGVAILNSLNNIVSNNLMELEILKCPLGKGSVFVQFINFNYPPKVEKVEKLEKVPTDSVLKPKSSFVNASMNSEILQEKEQQINELKRKLDYYEEENNDLKNLIKDFKRDIKTLTEEKKDILAKQKEQLQKFTQEKEDLQIQYMSLQQNMNLLQNNKTQTDQKVLDIKNQTDKQIKDLLQQVKNLNNIRNHLETENKGKEDKIINLEKKNKEISISYQKKLNELGTNYSSDKNNVLNNYNEQLKTKDDEIVKLNIKINSLEEQIQSLNETIENIKMQNKNELDGKATENMTKLLEKISEKDNKIFSLQKEITELNSRISNNMDNNQTQNMINTITEKEYQNNINDLQNIIEEKNNEINELKTKYETLKYQAKQNYNSKGENDEFDEGNNEIFINQLKEMQKTYKEREEKLISEKNEEIRKLKMRNKDLVRESVLENNNSIDITKYINEINRLKNLNNSLEIDIEYYKELNSKFMENEKKSTVFESENVKLKNMINEKTNEIEKMKQKQIEFKKENELLEKKLIESTEKMGNVLNDLAEAEKKCNILEKEKDEIKLNLNKVMNSGKK